jgi:hypothetical protein
LVVDFVIESGFHPPENLTILPNSLGLTALPKVIDIDDLDLSKSSREEQLRAAIKDGRYKNNWQKLDGTLDRSKATFAVSCGLIRAGIDPTTIAAVLTHCSSAVSGSNPTPVGAGTGLDAAMVGPRKKTLGRLAATGLFVRLPRNSPRWGVTMASARLGGSVDPHLAQRRPELAQIGIGGVVELHISAIVFSLDGTASGIRSGY